MAVPSCAGAYVSGAAGSNACPAGSVRIETQAACRTAAAAAGKTVGSQYFVETLSDYPRGCYHYHSTSNNYVWFNTHAVGAGISGYQLLCDAAASTGAPPRTTPRHVCVCSDARVRHTHTCATLACGAAGRSHCADCVARQELRWCGMGTGSVCMCAE